jgi:predicted small secreted protein
MTNARSLPLAVLLAGLALSGCSYARGVGFSEDLPTGRPTFVAGLPEGYWIWQDGDVWHLRLTSDVRRHFSGAVENVGVGGISEFRPVGKGTRGVRNQDGVIAFDLDVEGGEHGFDWKSPSGCNRFDIYIDGDSRPLRVFLGGVESSPNRVPFAICG